METHEGTLSEGTRVMINGIRGKPELNGCCGTVGTFHSESGRYKVTVDATQGGQVLALKRTVLEVLSSTSASDDVHRDGDQRQPSRADISTGVSLTKGLRIKLVNLRARPEMNGQYGFVEEWLEGSSRWKIKVDSGEILSLKAHCIQSSPNVPFNPNEVAPSWMREAPREPPDDIEELLLNPPKPPESCPKGASLWLLGRHLADKHTVDLANVFKARTWMHLKYLNVASNMISDLSFSPLMAAIADGALPVIEQLAVSDNPIGDSGASALAAAMDSMANLVMLEANGCSIGDRGAVALWGAFGKGNNTVVESVYMKDQKIGDEGFEAMCYAFRGGQVGALPKLCSIQLGGNELSDEGCLVIANAIEAGDLAPLRNLYLSPSPITVDGMEVVHQAIAEMDFKSLHVYF